MAVRPTSRARAWPTRRPRSCRWGCCSTISESPKPRPGWTKPLKNTSRVAAMRRSPPLRSASGFWRGCRGFAAQLEQPHPARVAAPGSAIENAERRTQCGLGDHREDRGLPPLRVDARPVVERSDDRAVICGRLEVIAVHMPDLRPNPAQHRPRDEPILLELNNAHSDVVAAQFGEVVERLAIHVDDELVTDRGDGIAVGVLQHARRVDRDVSLWVTEDGEDVGARRRDGALDLDPIAHALDPVTDWGRRERVPAVGR